MAKNHFYLLMTILFHVAIMASPATAALAASSAPTASPVSAMTNSSAPEAVLPASSTPTAYDMMDRYKITRGLLPQGVTGYVLRQDGSFEVYLPGDCNIRAAGMKVRYDSTIKGNIQTQSIRDLQGVHAKELFLWIGITQVSVADGQIKFSAGKISKSVPIDKFSSSPHCN